MKFGTYSDQDFIKRKVSGISNYFYSHFVNLKIVKPFCKNKIIK